MTRIFRTLLGKSIEVYINDMLVKSKGSPDHTMHLQETFELLRKYNLKLNPLKCAFEVNSGKFLDFMVTQRGIEANPIQLKAIMDFQTPTSRKLVQQLTCRLAADLQPGSLRVIHISLHISFEAILCHSKRSTAGRLESKMRPGSCNDQTVSHRTTRPR